MALEALMSLPIKKAINYANKINQGAAYVKSTHQYFKKRL